MNKLFKEAFEALETDDEIWMTLENITEVDLSQLDDEFYAMEGFVGDLLGFWFYDKVWNWLRTPNVLKDKIKGAEKLHKRWKKMTAGERTALRDKLLEKVETELDIGIITNGDIEVLRNLAHDAAVGLNGALGTAKAINTAGQTMAKSIKMFTKKPSVELAATIKETADVTIPSVKDRYLVNLGKLAGTKPLKSDNVEDAIAELKRPARPSDSLLNKWNVEAVEPKDITMLYSMLKNREKLADGFEDVAKKAQKASAAVMDSFEKMKSKMDDTLKSEHKDDIKVIEEGIQLLRLRFRETAAMVRRVIAINTFIEKSTSRFVLFGSAGKGNVSIESLQEHDSVISNEVIDPGSVAVIAAWGIYAIYALYSTSNRAHHVKQIKWLFKVREGWSDAALLAKRKEQAALLKYKYQEYIVRNGYGTVIGDLIDVCRTTDEFHDNYFREYYTLVEELQNLLKRQTKKFSIENAYKFADKITKLPDIESPDLSKAIPILDMLSGSKSSGGIIGALQAAKGKPDKTNILNDWNIPLLTYRQHSALVDSFIKGRKRRSKVKKYKYNEIMMMEWPMTEIMADYKNAISLLDTAVYGDAIKVMRNNIDTMDRLKRDFEESSSPIYDIESIAHDILESQERGQVSMRNGK